MCAVKRQTTATPLQALVLLNDPQFVEAARALAQRAMKDGGSTLADRITFIVRSLIGRRPSPQELAILEALYHEQYDEFRGGHRRPARAARRRRHAALQGLDPAQCAAMTVLAQAVLNHDELVMRR